MNASSVRVVYGKDAPQMVRDEEPFFIEKWSDAESGNEYVNEYRLVFSFEEGLLVEITQKLEGYIGAFTWEVPPNQLGIEGQARLKNSESLERIKAKVKEIVQGMTVHFTIMLERLAEMNSMSLEYLRSKYKEVVQRLTKNLDALFFDPIGGWRWIACYVCESDAYFECIRCSRDICNQHAVFAETEVGEPLIYCHECFDKVIEK
ncbi:MAG: hypothetical protein ACO2O1_03185 [Candidatus Caldarchaeales archaeon]|jgi:hypothetical protein